MFITKYDEEKHFVFQRYRSLSTTNRHSSYLESLHFTALQHICLKSVLILYAHLCLGLVCTVFQERSISSVKYTAFACGVVVEPNSH
jgi:hypothetical protein